MVCGKSWRLVSSFVGGKVGCCQYFGLSVLHDKNLSASSKVQFGVGSYVWQRRLQAAHNFWWGTDVPHSQSVHLQAGPFKQSAPYHGKGHVSNFQAHSRSTNPGPYTTKGKVICKLFNSKAGCHYRDCKFEHQCSQPGCQQKHSSTIHTYSKNM